MKWYNQLIFNIWLNTSTSLVIVWMVFGIYFHFVIYWYNYNCFMNMFFNHLISISKIFLKIYNLIPWVLNYFIPITVCKKPFNIKVLVEVQTHFKTNFYSNDLWSPSCVFNLWELSDIYIHYSSYSSLILVFYSFVYLLQCKHEKLQHFPFFKNV